MLLFSNFFPNKIIKQISRLGYIIVKAESVIYLKVIQKAP
jgi:hypothetical protein